MRVSSVLDFLPFAGGGFDLEWVLKPLFFRAPTKYSTKFPNQLSRCLEAKLLLLGPTAPKPLQLGPLSSPKSLIWKCLLLSKKTSPNLKLQVGRFKS
jgi:hypothetical protein